MAALTSDGDIAVTTAIVGDNDTDGEIVVTGATVIDALPFATGIQRLLDPYLVEPAKGVYVRGFLKPILKHGKQYYQDLRGPHGDLQRTPVMDVQSIMPNVPVVDDEGSQVIPPMSEHFRNLMLTPTPTVPVTGFQVVCDLVENTLNACNRWDLSAGNERNSDILRKHIKDEFLDLLHESEATNNHLLGDFEHIVAELIYAVRQFVGADRWIMHNYRLRGRDIIVEKTIDYRIWYFHHQQNIDAVRKEQEAQSD